MGKGIESSDVPPTAPVRETHRGAWAGLEEAVGRALLAVELAAREFAEGRARLASDERERLIAEIAQLEHALGEGWVPPGASRRPACADRVRCPRSCGRRRPTGGAARADRAPTRPATAFSAVASGVLVGLSETLARPRGALARQENGRAVERAPAQVLERLVGALERIRDGPRVELRCAPRAP